MATSKFIRELSEYALIEGVNTKVPLVGALVYIVPSGGTYPTGALQLTEIGTSLPGVYYRDAVPTGEFDYWIDRGAGPVKSTVFVRQWSGENALTTIGSHFDPADLYKLKTTGLKAQTKTVTSLTAPTPDYIGQPGRDAQGNNYVSISLSGTMWEKVDKAPLSLVMPNVELVSSSDYTTSSVGLLKNDGTILTTPDVGYDTFVMLNNYSANKFLFVKATFNSNIAVAYNNFALFDNNGIIRAIGTLHDVQVLAVPYNYTLKISLQHSVFPKYSLVTSSSLNSISSNTTNIAGHETRLDSIRVQINEGIGTLANTFDEISGTPEGSAGYYHYSTGAFVALAGWLSKKCPIDPTKLNFVTGQTNGPSTGLAVYYDSGGTFISSEFQGIAATITQYSRQLLTVPDNAAYVGVTSYGSKYSVLEEGSIVGLNSIVGEVDSIHNSSIGFIVVDGVAESVAGY